MGSRKVKGNKDLEFGGKRVDVEGGEDVMFFLSLGFRFEGYD